MQYAPPRVAQGHPYAQGIVGQDLHRAVMVQRSLDDVRFAVHTAHLVTKSIYLKSSS